MGELNPTGVNSPEIDAPPYSTFAPGAEPDVWPEMENAAPWRGAALGALAALLVACWLAVAWLPPLRPWRDVGVRP